MFMRVPNVFLDFHLRLSEIKRNLAIWAGMEGLRHKARHKFLDGDLIGWWAQNWAQCSGVNP